LNIQRDIGVVVQRLLNIEIAKIMQNSPTGSTNPLCIRIA